MKYLRQQPAPLLVFSIQSLRHVPKMPANFLHILGYVPVRGGSLVSKAQGNPHKPKQFNRAFCPDVREHAHGHNEDRRRQEDSEYKTIAPMLHQAENSGTPEQKRGTECKSSKQECPPQRLHSAAHECASAPADSS